MSYGIHLLVRINNSNNFQRAVQKGKESMPLTFLFILVVVGNAKKSIVNSLSSMWRKYTVVLLLCVLMEGQLNYLYKLFVLFIQCISIVSCSSIYHWIMTFLYHCIVYHSMVQWSDVWIYSWTSIWFSEIFLNYHHHHHQ